MNEGSGEIQGMGKLAEPHHEGGLCSANGESSNKEEQSKGIALPNPFRSAATASISERALGTNQRAHSLFLGLADKSALPFPPSYLLRFESPVMPLVASPPGRQFQTQARQWRASGRTCAS